MNAKYYKLLIVLAGTGLVLALAVAGFLILQGNPQTGSAAAAKEPAPNFTLALVDGKSFQSGEHKGKPILINFFASWCLPCREEMPVLVETARKYGPRGVVFLGVAVDDTEEKMKDFIVKYDVDFPVGLDKTAEIQKSFGLYGIPTTYFVDRQGTINYFHSGAVTAELLQHELDKLL